MLYSYKYTPENPLSSWKKIVFCFPLFILLSWYSCFFSEALLYPCSLQWNFGIKGYPRSCSSVIEDEYKLTLPEQCFPVLISLSVKKILWEEKGKCNNCRSISQSLLTEYDNIADLSLISSWDCRTAAQPEHDVTDAWNGSLTWLPDRAKEFAKLIV